MCASHTTTTRLFFAACLAMLGIAVVPTQTHAAGTLVIEQKNSVNVFGEWTLSRPNLSVLSGDDESRTTSVTESGSYTINVQPPRNAITNITVYEDTVNVASVEQRVLEQVMDPAKDYRLVIEYKYNNTVHVDSEPRGASFVLEGAYDNLYMGVTPATFENLPPVQFTARFNDNIEDCAPPRPMIRVPRSDREIQFFGRYDCTNPEPVVVEPTPAPTTDDEFVDGQRGSVDIWLSPHTQEVTPGGQVNYSIGVKNHSRTTMRNLTVAMQIESDHTRIRAVLPKGGTVQGNAIVWEIDELFAGQIWRVTFPVEVLSSTPEGTRIRSNVRVGSNDIDPDTSRRLSDAVTIGLPFIPRTGSRYDIAFLLLTGMLGAGYALLRRKQVHS